MSSPRRSPLRTLLEAPVRAVTYTRWLHLVAGGVAGLVVAMVFPGFAGSPTPWEWLRVMSFPMALAAALGLALPVMRRAEGIQARLMLVPGRHDPLDADAVGTGIAVVPSASWHDRWRTALWLALRVLLGTSMTATPAWLTMLSWHLIVQRGGWYVLPGLLPPLLLPTLVVGAGALTAALARRLLAPSAAERLAALEERTERLLEHNRLARELHDSIGHALTATVVQAGAARAAGSAEFTGRALAAIEDTGRRALEDLERVLRLLREGDGGRPAGKPPTLREASRLLESARLSGAEVTAEIGGLEAVPAVVSREGYRILQEALTNVLRHAGPVPVEVSVAVSRAGAGSGDASGGGDALRLAVANLLPDGYEGPGSGSGLRGVRERAALLGGTASAGPVGRVWRLEAVLPLDGYGRR